jgi:hypothetical protein
MPLFSNAMRNDLNLEISLFIPHNVDLSPLADGLSTGVNDDDDGVSLVKQNLSLPVTHCPLREHVMPLARLPPTLVDVTIDVCNASDTAVHLHIDNDIFVRLFGRHAQLRCLIYLADSHELTIAALASLGQRYHRLLDLVVHGRFALGQLALNRPLLFPQLRFLAMSGSQPAERCMVGDDGPAEIGGIGGAAPVLSDVDGSGLIRPGGAPEKAGVGDLAGGLSLADEMIAKDVLLKVSYDAPTLNHLAMTDGGPIDTMINKQWVKMGPGRTSYKTSESD